MNKVDHWEKIYATRNSKNVGWFAPHLETSMKWITGLELAEQDPIIDVGGGASTLVDDLLASGHENLTLLDLSQSAIQLAKQRLGKLSASVTWLHGDITIIGLLPQHYTLWHDRAVFHFLIEPEIQQRYKDALLHALKKGGFFIIGTFTSGAPSQCSGLPVQRYTLESLDHTFGKEFELIRYQNEIHKTPSGIEQTYVYCLFQRAA